MGYRGDSSGVVAELPVNPIINMSEKAASFQPLKMMQLLVFITLNIISLNTNTEVRLLER